jgi:hypothetical protein
MRGSATAPRLCVCVCQPEPCQWPQAGVLRVLAPVTVPGRSESVDQTGTIVQVVTDAACAATVDATRSTAATAQPLAPLELRTRSNLPVRRRHWQACPSALPRACTGGDLKSQALTLAFFGFWTLLGLGLCHADPGLRLKFGRSPLASLKLAWLGAGPLLHIVAAVPAMVYVPSFERRIISTTQTTASRALSADVNDDGLLDVVACGESGTAGNIVSWLSLGGNPPRFLGGQSIGQISFCTTLFVSDSKLALAGR